jgi:hypothetical protein
MNSGNNALLLNKLETTGALGFASNVLTLYFRTNFVVTVLQEASPHKRIFSRFAPEGTSFIGVHAIWN